MNKADAVHEDMEELEVEIPCGTPKCSNTATWAGWVSHSNLGCPNSAFACNRCKNIVDKWWVGVIGQMETHDVKCSQCAAEVDGYLSQHLRWLPL